MYVCVESYRETDRQALYMLVHVHDVVRNITWVYTGSRMG